MSTRKLHIGGTAPHDGWEILNANSAEYVDHLGKAEDLSRFAENTFAEVYASHVLEHLGYQSLLQAALAEWFRVLKPGGRLMVSVPDLDTLCALFCQRDAFGPDERFALMRMMFGGQTDSFDFHYVGLNEEFLSSFLSRAGFIGLERVPSFGLFQDCSEITFHGRAISLNMKAHKPTSTPGQSTSDMPINARVMPPPPPSLTKQLQTGSALSWGSGYYTDIPYGSYCFKELAPGWIDYALLSQRQRPPRQRDGLPFSYLELGSGMGLGLCLLAAAYPEGQFVGVDFHPSHIANSQWLMAELGLTNVRFYEADFVEMADSDQPLPFAQELHFDYVVAHGIISWISPSVRTALYRLAGRLLRSGGAFYCSYNTFPGWLDRTAFKALLDVERLRLGHGNLLAAIEQASSSLNRLLQSSLPLAQSQPRLSSNLSRIASIQQTDYLFGEYGHEHWQPFYVNQVHQQIATHKLSYVASASLPENHTSLLPPQLSSLLAEENDPTIRQLLLDLAINQSFRRDLFVKGPLRLSTASQQQLLSQLRLCATSTPSSKAESDAIASGIPTSLGTISDDNGRIQQVEALLTQHPASLAEIHQALDIPPEDLVLLTSLLLHAGRVSLDRGAAGDAAMETCQSVNRRILALMQEGHNLGFLAAPRVGHGAQPFTLPEVFILEALQQGLDHDILHGCVLMGLQASGAEMRSADGTQITDTDRYTEEINKYIQRFRATTLPRLIQLGIVDPADLPG